MSFFGIPREPTAAAALEALRQNGVDKHDLLFKLLKKNNSFFKFKKSKTIGGYEWKAEGQGFYLCLLAKPLGSGDDQYMTVYNVSDK